MYFEKTDSNAWNYKEAFLEYYEKFNDIQNTANAIKKVLELFVTRPNVFKTAIKKAQLYLDNFKVDIFYFDILAHSTIID